MVKETNFKMDDPVFYYDQGEYGPEIVSAFIIGIRSEQVRDYRMRITNSTIYRVMACNIKQTRHSWDAKEIFKTKKALITKLKLCSKSIRRFNLEKERLIILDRRRREDKEEIEDIRDKRLELLKKDCLCFCKCHLCC